MLSVELSHEIKSRFVKFKDSSSTGWAGKNQDTNVNPPSILFSFVLQSVPIVNYK